MSQITADHVHGHGHGDHHHAHAGFDLSESNISPSGLGNGLSGLMMVLGLAGLVGVGIGWTTAGASHAMMAVHIGAMVAMAITLGGLFLVMATHLIGAGWSVTIRRQMENIASMVPYVGMLVIGTLAADILLGGKLFPWLDKSRVAGDYLFEKKAAYLNPVFFMIRAVVYVFVWSFLARRLLWLSQEQDRTGDKWLTNKARFTSSWGMLIFALTVAFAGFDWLKSIDWRYFSTMWGVYFFAGAMYSAVATLVLVLAYLRANGKLEGLVTDEHTHDLGKLQFAFTVFWAYIAFSQYFLTWYANIPEETMFYLPRKTGGWEYLFYTLCFGHFVLPFYLLLWRKARRTLGILAIFAAWSLLMQVADIFWIIRPQLYAQTEDSVRVGLLWVDAAGIFGVLFLFFGMLLWKVNSGVLIPTRDPRLPESLHHKNYV